MLKETGTTGVLLKKGNKRNGMQSSPVRWAANDFSPIGIATWWIRPVLCEMQFKDEPRALRENALNGENVFFQVKPDELIGQRCRRVKAKAKLFEFTFTFLTVVGAIIAIIANYV